MIRFIFIFIILIFTACNSKTKNKEKIESDTIQIDKNPKVNETTDKETLEKSIEKGVGVIETEQGNLSVDGKLNPDINILTGKFNYTQNKYFTKVEPAYCNKTIYIQKEVYNSFLKMVKAAEKDEVKFKIISGARNFEHQKSIWERKWNKSNIQNHEERAKHILKYSSMPMTSRHHWGTDIDLNSLDNSYFESGRGLKEYQWLQKNAGKFGFCQVYTNKNENQRTGYNMEKWHWSYMPISSKYLKKYNRLLTYEDYTGFLGNETAKPLQVIGNYVNGIGCQ